MTTISSKTKSANERSIDLLASAFLTLAEEMIDQEHASDTPPQEDAEGLIVGSSADAPCNYKGGMK